MSTYSGNSNWGGNQEGSSLYIADLTEDAMEVNVLEHFEDKGFSIKQLSIFRDFATMKSRRRGQITFFSVSDAEKALKEMNYSEILGRPCRLMKYRKGVAHSTNSNIFVKNIGGTTSEQLHSKFSEFGSIFSATVRTDEEGKSKGYGYVQYENKDAAEYAIKEINGKEWNGRIVEASLFRKRNDREPTYNNLYVRGIPKHFSNEDLQKYFEQMGEILSAVVIKEQDGDGENKGFGFVCYKDGDSAKKAVDELDGSVLGEGLSLMIAMSVPKPARKRELREKRLKDHKDCNVYVKRLPIDIDDKDLKEEFGEYGEVVSSRVMKEWKQDPITKESSKISKGFGFICFANSDQAKNCITGINSSKHFDTNLFANMAENKEDRVRNHMRDSQNYPQWAMMNMYSPYRGGGPMGHMRFPRGGGGGYWPRPAGYGMRPDMPYMYMPYPPRRSNYGGQRYNNRDGGRGKRTEGRGGNRPRYNNNQNTRFNNNNYGYNNQGPRAPMHDEMHNMGHNMPHQNMHQPMMMPGMMMPNPMAMDNQMMGRPMMGMQQMPNMNPHMQQRPPMQPEPVPTEDIGAEQDIQQLGEKLYPLVESREPENAAKITGMLLEMEKEAIVNIIKDERALDRMILEAQNVLKTAVTE